MNVVEVNKYSPAMFRNRRFLRDDWTSVSQVGETWGGEVVTVARYLAVEDLYVRAVTRFMDAAGIDEVCVHGREQWEDRELTGLPLPPRAAPHEGERIAAPDTGDVLRRFLRELAWAELAVAPRFLVHPGYDFRLLIATNVDTTAVEEEVRRSGLFVYRGDYDLPTLDAWTTGKGT